MSRISNAFDFRKSVGYDAEAKRLFHSHARSQLRRIATALGLEPVPTTSAPTRLALPFPAKLSSTAITSTCRSPNRRWATTAVSCFGPARAGRTMSAARTISHRSTCPANSRIGSARCAVFDVIRRSGAIAASWARRHSYRCGVRLSRWTRAWRYAAGRLSADEAQRLMLDCRMAGKSERRAGRV